MNLFGRTLFAKREKVKGLVDRVHFNSVALLDGADLSVAEAFPGQQTTMKADYASLVYNQSPYVNAAIRIIAGSLSSVPLNVYMKERTGSQKKPKLTGEPQNLLNWVNPQMTQGQLVEYTASWLLLNGNAYWAIEETPREYRDNSAWSIYPMNPMYVTIRPDPDTGVNGYFYKKGREGIFIPENRVIHFRNFSTDDYWYGSPILSSLKTDLDIERLSKRQLANFFKHAAVISGVLNVQQDLSDDEVRKMRKDFFSKHGGASNAHRLLILTNGMTYEPLKSNVNESNSVPIIDQTLGIHAMVMGVPVPVLLGDTDGSKLIEAEALMWKKTIIPLGNLIGQTITKQLAMPLSNRLIVSFDYSNVEALRLQDLDRTRVEVAHVIAGIRTPNEIRSERNWGDIPEDSDTWGDSPTPVYNLENQPVSPSLSLPGSRGGRDQSSSGEAEMADTTARRSVDYELMKELLKDFFTK